MLRLLLMIVILTVTLNSQAKTIQVKLETNRGDIYFDLYPEKAPTTVANFLKYIDAGHFDGGSFYRVVHMQNQAQNNIKIEVIQGGISGKKDAQYFDPIPLERTRVTGIKHLDGTLSMARLGPDSATAEFFICINAQPSLDFGGQRNPDGQGFAAFGRVSKGMDVVRDIQKLETDNPEGEMEYTSGQMLVEPVKFISFKRL